jgi:hypothetical protein
MTCDTAPNPKIVIAPPETARAERLVDVYAYIVGSGVGVALTTVVARTGPCVEVEFELVANYRYLHWPCGLH